DAAPGGDAGLSKIELEGLAEETHRVYERCQQTLGIGHPLTLAAALARCSFFRRLPDYLHDAARIASGTCALYSQLLGQTHPYTHECASLYESIRSQLEMANEQIDLAVPGSDFTPLPL